MTDATWTGVVALIASAIGALGAIAGGWWSSKANREALERQLKHADASRLHETRTVAYDDLLTTSDRLYFATTRFIAYPDTYGSQLDECRNAFRAAQQRVTLVAPRETVMLAVELSEKLSQILNQNGTHEAQERATHARLAFWTAARVDLGIDAAGDLNSNILPPLPRPEEIRGANREARRRDGRVDSEE